MRELSQVLGFVGAMIVAIGYLPQIWHLAREHCSAGISVSAWWIWLVSSVLIATHAVDFWLSTEDLPRPENRVTVDQDGKLTVSYTETNVEARKRLYEKVKSIVGDGSAT